MRRWSSPSPSGDDATIVRVVNQVILPSLVPSLLEQTLARTADAMVRAERLGDPVLLFFAAHARATAVFLAGDIDEMDRCIEIMGSLAEQLDQPILSWTNTFHLSKRAQIAGDTDLAEQLATEALQIGTDCGQPDAAFFFGGQLLVVSAQRGTMGELIPLIEQMVDESPAIAGMLTSVLALAHAEADHTEDARHLLEEFAAADFDLPMGPGWITEMYCYAEAAIHCGDPKYAGPLFDRLAPWAEQSVASGSVTASGLVSHSLGGLATVLGRYDEADAYFNQSSASERPHEGQVLWCHHRSPLGVHARRTPGRGRHREGSGPSDKGAHRGNGPRVQERRTPRSPRPSKT